MKFMRDDIVVDIDGNFGECTAVRRMPTFEFEDYTMTGFEEHFILAERPPRKLMGKEPRLVQLGYDYYYRWEKGKWNILEDLKEHIFNTDRIKNCRSKLEAVTAWNVFVDKWEAK